jgi:hypothetical protein
VSKPTLPPPSSPAAQGWYKAPTRRARWCLVVEGSEDQCWAFLLGMRECGDKVVLPVGRHPRGRDR